MHGRDDAASDRALHEPVLREESAHWLALAQLAEGALLVDCTVGLGGHADYFLQQNASLRLLGLDRDPEALAHAGRRLARFGDRVRLVEARFSSLAEVLDRGGEVPSACFADLGVSSLQLDRGERGFSFRHDGPLDMRMGAGHMTAKRLVNELPEFSLEQILRDRGEERQARRIARAIVAARAERPLETTAELRQVVAAAKGRGARPRPGVPYRDPATKVFQALRIEVNEELDELRSVLDCGIERLREDGRLVVISYHSLEDRIVKHALREAERGDIDPITGRSRADTKALEVLTKKPVRPSEAEIRRNPRSRSGRLRAARRI